MTGKAKLSFEIIYKKYSQMLYGIAIEISPTEKQAEELLVETFKKAFQLKLNELDYPSICMSLINLIIQTAHEKQNNNQGKTNFKLKQFENTPLLHQLICEQVTMENHCTDNEILRDEARKKLRSEFSLMRNI